MEKVYDLKRKMTERKIKRGISNIADLKINENKDNFKSVVRKIAKNIISPIVFDEMLSTDDKINKLCKLVNGTNDNVLVKIEELDTFCYRDELINYVVYEKNYTSKNRPAIDSIKKVKSVEVTFSDVFDNTISFISKFGIELKNKCRSKWTLKSKFKYIPVCDLSTALAEVYLYNQLHKYVISNIDVEKFIIFKKVIQYSSYDKNNPEEKEKIKDLLGHFEIDFSESLFRRDETNIYLEWLDSNPYNYFSHLGKYYIQGNNPSLQHYWSEKEKVLAFLFYMKSENEEIENDYKRERDISSDYAKSYETKKNIPLKIKAAMNQSKFNKYFGFTEFDELIDLAKIKQVETEFIEFAKKVTLPIYKDHSLRFRRLGKHNASGLYFPTAKSVCIDLKGVSATVHELCHMIDYNTHINAKLSDMFNFRPIIDAYKECIDQEVNKLPLDNTFRIKFKGNSKYNKNYYYCHTEIFARCGEIYFRRILKMDTSILGNCKSIMYPDNKRLNKMIEKYFSSLFAINTEEVEHKIASSILVMNTDGQYMFNL